MSTYLSFGYSDISDGIESYIADITNNKDESKSREEYTAEVMKKYPQYFGLKTSHGLDVVFWTAVPDSYSFALFEHSDKLHDDSDKALNDTELIGVTIDEMKAILATYTEANLIDANDIHLIPRRDTSTNNVGVFWLRFTDETDEEVEARRAEYIENIRKLLPEN